MRLYDVILRVVHNHAPCLDDTMARHRLVHALERELRYGDHGWVVMRKPEPKRVGVRRLFTSR